jgi:hypothetical protein
MIGQRPSPEVESRYMGILNRWKRIYKQTRFLPVVLMAVWLTVFVLPKPWNLVMVFGVYASILVYLPLMMLFDRRTRKALKAMENSGEVQIEKVPR